VKALVYRFSPLVFAAARAGLAGAGLALEAIPPPEPPSGDWVPLRTVLAGICGTDLAALSGRLSPALLPFSSFPSVPGHEILAVDPDGRRVVVDPFLGCAARGLPPCVACAAGQPARCENFAAGSLAPGTLIGFCRDAPGGWGEAVVAPRGQIYPVPDGVDDRRAVLVEPLAVALHAVLLHPPAPRQTVAVVGAGTIGLLTLAARRLLELPCRVVAVARHGFQAELARALGADAVSDDPVRAALDWGARSVPTLLAPPVIVGGFDVIYDCVGSEATLGASLRTARSGGAVVLVGTAGPARVDWTYVWSRELRLVGAVGYGRENWGGSALHTFELALRLLEARPDLPVERLLTHTFPLEGYRQALATARRRAGSPAVKVAFRPG
jgi:threonine dehydrogenase-like Zn-dependent dehydrogenase